MNTLTISKPLPPIIDDVVPDDDDMPPLAGERPHAEPETAVEELPATPFPMHCLPGVAGDMAREIGRVTTAQNETLAAASVLAILSASIGAGIRASTGGERYVRANLYVKLIAESGTGKGENFKLAAQPFEACEIEAIERFDRYERPGLDAKLHVAELRAKKLSADAAKMPNVADREAATEEYARAEAEMVKIRQQIESAPKWKVADVTKEALAMILQRQPGEAVASLSSEARGILSIVKGKYSKQGGDEDLYCSAYSGDSVTVDRVGRPRVTLKEPCLAILWMIQPDAARMALAEDSFTDSGLLPRFLICDPKAEPQERFSPPDPIPVATKEKWATLIRSLAWGYRILGGDPMTVNVSHEATEILHEYERENIRRRCSKGDLRDLAPYVSRWTENAWKIAIVLHCAKHGGQAHSAVLEEASACNAVEIMRWFSDRQLEVLQVGRREKHQKRVLALLAVLAEAKGEISIRDLRRTHGFEEEEVRQLNTLFPKRFTIEKRQGAKGRSSTMVTQIR
jgi:hypothetical protein